MITYDASHCKNCQAELHGAFCAQCGQKVILHRLTFSRFVSDLLRQFTDVDRGLWHTLWMLFKRPGGVVRDYLNGITVPYTPPVRYLILWITISFLAYFSLGNFEQQMAEMEVMFPPEANQFQLEWQQIMQRYSQLFALINVPVMALMTWLFFRRKGMNYTEHLMGNAYWYGQVSLLSMLILPVQNLLNKHALLWGTALALILMQVCYAWAIKDLFSTILAGSFLQSVVGRVAGLFLIFPDCRPCWSNLRPVDDQILA